MVGTNSHGLGRRSTRLSAVSAPVAPSRPPTKELLIEAGERLFGHHGFDGISLREIGAAAGQGSNNVVQYHFKDKVGLINAIVDDRVKRMEIFQQELLQDLKKGDPNYSRALLKIFWLPTIMIKDINGDHSFCRFLLQLMLQANLSEHPLSNFYDIANGKAVTKPKSTSCILKATRLLKAHFSQLSNDILRNRMTAQNLMFLAMIVEYDNSRHRDKKKTPKEFDLESILDMSLAALNAPT